MKVGERNAIAKRLPFSYLEDGWEMGNIEEKIFFRHHPPSCPSMRKCLYQGLTPNQDGEGIAFSNLTKETGADGTGAWKLGWPARTAPLNWGWRAALG